MDDTKWKLAHKYKKPKRILSAWKWFSLSASGALSSSFLDLILDDIMKEGSYVVDVKDA